MPKFSRAMRAVRMLELSPLVTAATAVASSMPAAARSVRSNPNPTTLLPAKLEGSRRKAPAFLSMMATVLPAFSSAPASSLPTLPPPTTMTCTAPPPFAGDAIGATRCRFERASPGSVDGDGRGRGRIRRWRW